MTTAEATRPLEWAPPRQAISKIPYLPGLDGMRALAVIAVMLYHADSSWLPGGFLGVEVFFVISGYLITMLLIGEHEQTGRVSLSTFWLRRARRLLPALFLMMILVTIYTALFRRDALGQLRGDVVGGFFYVSNWYQIWVGQGYTAAGDFAPLRHLWSLAVEEQFYLLWPLAMIGLMRLGRRRLPDMARWLFLAAVGVTVLVAVAHHPGQIGTCGATPAAYWDVGGRCLSKTDTLYLGTFTRSGGLLMGAAFAMIWRPVAIMRGPIRKRGAVVDGVAVLGLGGLAALTWYVHLITPDGADPWLFRGGFLLCGIATVAVIAAVTHRGAVAGRLLGNPVLSWIGTRSYGLYLYHWPIYQIIREVAGVALTFAEFVIAMACTAVITELSYRFVETPIRRGTLAAWWRKVKTASDPSSRRLIAGAGAACVALSLFAGVNLATAELRQNEIAESLDEGDEAVSDVLTEATDEPQETDPPSNTPPPTSVVRSDVANPTQPSAVVPPPETRRPRTTTTAEPERPPTTDAPPPTTAPPDTALPDGPISVLAIGDSVMQGAADEMTERGITVDAEQNRQMNTTVGALRRLRDEGRLPEAVIVHLGTNGYVSEETVEEFFEALAGVPRVVALTINADIEWEGPNNSLLYDVPSRFPNVQLIDWSGLAEACPGDCFYSDDIHINQAGQDYYTQLIVDTLGI